MVKRYAKKFLMLLLLCSSWQHIQAVDWPTAFVGVILTLCGLVSDDQQQEQRNNKPQRQNTSVPTQTHRPQSTYAQQKPNKQQLFDSIEKRLRELTDIDNQSASIKEGLWKKKQEVVTNTLKQNFTTHAQAEKYAFEHLPGGIREFFVTKVVEHAQENITSSQKRNDLKRIEEYFGHQIDQKLSIKKPVTDLFKNLSHDVDSYIQKYVNQKAVTTQQRPAVVHDYRPSAPRIEEFDRPVNTPNLYPDLSELQSQAGAFIEEILPQNETARSLDEFKEKTRDGQIYYEQECILKCGKSFFTELKQRVNLTCGHQFCLFCLIEWMATQQKQKLQPTCPNCRHPIDSKDFNLAYLRSRI